MKHLLFVYGTLMSGMRNNRVLDGAVMITSIELPGRLYSAGVPFFVYDPDADTYVQGEVWEVDDAVLANTDRLEGYNPKAPHQHADWYTRTVVRHPTVGEMFAYTVADAPNYSTHVPHGSYRELRYG